MRRQCAKSPLHENVDHVGDIHDNRASTFASVFALTDSPRTIVMMEIRAEWMPLEKPRLKRHRWSS